MISRIREIDIVVAYEVVLLVQIDRHGILHGMVYRSAAYHHCIFSRLKRESGSVSRELPYNLHNRHIIWIRSFSRDRVVFHPHIRTLGIVRVGSPETQPVKILDLGSVVVKNHIFVRLVSPFQRICRAAPIVDFLEYYVPRNRFEQIYRDILVRVHKPDLVGSPVEHILFRPVAHRDTVDAVGKCHIDFAICISVCRVAAAFACVLDVYGHLGTEHIAESLGIHHSDTQCVQCGGIRVSIFKGSTSTRDCGHQQHII